MHETATLSSCVVVVTRSFTALTHGKRLVAMYCYLEWVRETLERSMKEITCTDTCSVLLRWAVVSTSAIPTRGTGAVASPSSNDLQMEWDYHGRGQ